MLLLLSGIRLQARAIQAEAADECCVSIPGSTCVHCPPIAVYPVSKEEAALEGTPESKPSLPQLTVEEQFDQYYKGKPGINGLTSHVYTEPESGLRFRRVSVSPNGSCYFYALDLSRKDVADVLCDQVDQYDARSQFPGMTESIDTYDTLSRLHRRVLDPFQKATTLADLQKLATPLNDTLTEPQTPRYELYRIEDGQKKTALIVALRELMSHLVRANGPVQSIKDSCMPIVEAIKNLILDFFNSSTTYMKELACMHRYRQTVSNIFSTFTTHHPHADFCKEVFKDSDNYVTVDSVRVLTEKGWEHFFKLSPDEKRR